MNWYKFDTMFKSLKDGLSEFLKRNGIYYELSGYGANYHFEIFTDGTGAAKVKKYLDENTIYCAGVKK